ncbi:YihY/virulence factor BrkB family protein [Wenyingzhuangia aestuarii]|uniref:YihY/virulence factor BrkB family protein n=1 Tax=Wenyingzhuangia aestuarii TaxID=1647582 RepID=UPI001439481D|nr:YihY/virulence factor BrkB family protein [Wenyingzhuangia aestuarii]NJB84118.1 membrane protein [Wenyingzhuangia aestuarii]
MIKIKEAGTLIKKTYKNWIANDPFQLSAAVSYYALFSFPALLIIIIQTAGLFYDRSEIKNKILLEIGSVLGKDSADSIQTIIKNAVVEDQTTFAFIVGIATLLYGATGLFIALQKSLNTIWEVPYNKTVGFFKMIKNRLFSLSLVLIIGFLLLISMVVTTIISGISNWIEANFSDFLLRIIHLVNFFVSLGIITVLFGMIFKILPDVHLKWKHVWLGAFVTSLLFDIGKFGLGVYFGTLNPESTFGAAGSIVLILLWVSYSSLILFFGAEFTKVYSETMLKKEKLEME